MSDGVWSIGGPLLGAPELQTGVVPSAKWRDETYKHFTTGNARVTYVEGEFPWQVLVNDVAQANDYVCPPNMLSIEVQHSEHGVDVNFTSMQPIEPAQVWAAFNMPDAPPAKRGIHPAEPNPHATKFYWVAAILLFVTWIAALIMYSSARETAVVYEGKIVPGEVLTQEIDLGEPGSATTLEFELRASGMNNSWALRRGHARRHELRRGDQTSASRSTPTAVSTAARAGARAPTHASRPSAGSPVAHTCCRSRPRPTPRVIRPTP